SPAIGRSVCGGAFYPKFGPRESSPAPAPAKDQRSKALKPPGQFPVVAGEGAGGSFPQKWRGKFFFLDFMNHWLKALDPEAPTNVFMFARGFNGPVAVEVAADGSLLVLNRGTIWRDPRKFTPNSGSLVRIRYAGA